MCFIMKTLSVYINMLYGICHCVNPALWDIVKVIVDESVAQKINLWGNRGLSSGI